MASRLGIFLYPTGTFLEVSTVAISWLCFSSLSAVSESPSVVPSLDGVVDRGLDCAIESDDGDVDRVLGGFTAIESAADATVESDVDEAVRRTEATRRGRGALGGFKALMCGPSLLFKLIRAARAFRDGKRLAGLAASVAGGEVEVMSCADQVKGPPHHMVGIARYYNNLSHTSRTECPGCKERD